MAGFADRQVKCYQLPLASGVKLLHPETAVMVYCKGCSTDLGALCYLRRSSHGRAMHQGRRVDLTSFSEIRVREIRALVDHVSKHFEYSGLAPRTLYGRLRDFIRFMDWCDSNAQCDVLATETGARAGYRGYVEFLRQMVSQNQIGNNTATRYQDIALVILQDFLNVENLDRGVNRLMQSSRLAEPTTVPDDAAQEKVLAWCKTLLNGLSELVVDQKPYPFPLTVPGYLNWKDNRLWVFPVVRWCESPDDEAKQGYRAFDYRNGRVRTPTEIKQLYGPDHYPGQTNYLVKTAERYIARSNQDFLSYDRIQRGMLAAKAFLMMFIASTGKSPTQAVETPWSEEIDESVRNPIVERQNYRAIKYRANNRIVHFEIGIEYMPYLRRYLLLRKHLLNGKRCAHLFFAYGHGRSGIADGPVPISTKFSYSMYLTLRHMAPNLPKVIPMQWRAAKQDHVIRHHDPVTAARAMQHTLSTALRKYSNGSEVVAQIEIGDYLRHVERVVLKKGQKIDGAEERSIGVCSRPKQPKAIANHLPVIPDCKSAEGCLFCNKYRVHADERDTRKLLSARYCVRATSHLASSPEQFRRLFGAVLQRIDHILSEIKRRDGKMVERIEQEVDIEGELAPFWSGKLGMLIELELV